MPQKIWLVGLLAAVAAASWAAAPVRAAEEKAKPVVAVLDFAVVDAAVPYDFREKAGKICANTLVETLQIFQYHELAERAKIDAVVNEVKLQASGLVDDEKAAEIGKLLAANYLVYGEVQSVEITAGNANVVAGAIGQLGGLLGGAAKKAKSSLVRVNVNYKVTEVETGKVVLARNIKEETEVIYAVDGPEQRVKALNDVLQKTARKMARAMLPKCEGIVAAVNANDGTVIVTVGTQHGVIPGTMMRVFRKGAEVKNPQTGEVIDVQITEVCKARCQAAKEKASTLELGDLVAKRRSKDAEWKVLKEKAADVKVGDLVETIEAP